MNRIKIINILYKNVQMKPWMEHFKDLDNLYYNKTLDLICIFEKEKDNLTDKYYVELYGIKDKVANIDVSLHTEETLETIFIEVFQRLESMHNDLEEVQDILNSKAKDIMNHIGTYAKDIAFEMSLYQLDYNTFIKRMHVFIEKLRCMVATLVSDFFETSLIEDVRDDLKIVLQNFLAYSQNKYANEKLNSKQKNKQYLKIFSPKDMIKLAESNGYVQTRTNGDHIIMLNERTNKIVPIPYHSLGYGLMLNIQKQIHTNSI